MHQKLNFGVALLHCISARSDECESYFNALKDKVDNN